VRKGFFIFAILMLYLWIASGAPSLLRAAERGL
jgi:hypothetical protein